MLFISGVMIHLIIPIAGITLYLLLRERLSKYDNDIVTQAALICVFVNYGGWLLVFLILLFWYWSGMASLGLAYLVFIAPFIMVFFAVFLYPKRKVSRYHHGSYLASLAYTPLLFVVLAIRKFLI